MDAALERDIERVRSRESTGCGDMLVIVQTDEDMMSLEVAETSGLPCEVLLAG